jgi:large subunit ribosomal protein L21
VYAVIEDSGQQFRVQEGDVLEVDLRDLAEDQTEIQFDRVLLVSGDGNVSVGTPVVAGAKVLAEIVDPLLKGQKVYISQFRRRKDSRRRIGHRQKFIQVRVKKIVA